jgi:lipoate-protein ligase A
MPDNSWRLLLTGAGAGPENMASDEALALCETSPTIRFYQWPSPCISIGRYQDFHSIFKHNPPYSSKIPVIRRPTGGRAILHQQEELTYSITIPRGHKLRQVPTQESYTKINQALIMGLSVLGINATTATRKASLRGQRANIACYESAYPHELIVGSRKIIASAQTRSGGIFLQQGTLPLKQSGHHFGESISIPRKEKITLAERLNENTATPSQILGHEVTIHEIQGALISGFEKAWDIHLTRSEMSSEEHRKAAKLARIKYSDETWTTEGTLKKTNRKFNPENFLK